MKATVKAPVHALLVMWRRYWQWMAILGMAAVTVVLGCIGFWKVHAVGGNAPRVLDVLYYTIQLFTMNSGAVSGPVPWELEVARYLAPLVPAWTVLKALGLVFREQLQLFRMRFYSGHVVICGLGRKGLQLTREFRAQGDRVVVIDIEKENTRFKSVQELGALVLAGNAADKAILRKARVFSARHVIAVSTKDGKNVEIAVLTSELVQEHQSTLKNRVTCFVHIVDLELCALFKHHRIFTDTTDFFEPSVVNVYANVARSLLEDHPLDRKPMTVSERQTVHLVIIGFGHTGENTAVQAARIGHYANGKKLRVSVVDRFAEDRKRRFYARYPQFDEVCDATFLNGDIGDNAMLEQVRQWAHDPDSLTTILVSLGSDSGSVVAGLSVLSKLDRTDDVPILVRMSEREALASLLSGGQGNAKWANRVHAVGLIGRVCTQQMFLNKELDVLAKAIHEDFVEERKQEGKPDTDASLQPWERLDQEQKDSNRQQADHIAVKLRAIGCRSVEGDRDGAAAFAFSADEVELLARMEFARWKAHRFLTGWVRGPQKDSKEKISPCLGEWDDLPADIKEYNRQAVRNIPRLLRLVGRHIQRVG